MARTLETFTKQQIDEVFSHPAIREVAFEIRFAARLRVNAELWKLQDQLVEQYPNTGTESAMQPNAAILTVNVFQNALAGRVIKVSQENFVIAFTRYSRFEDFKEEVVNRTSTFCATFGVKSLTRVGLRSANRLPHYLDL